MNRAFLTLAILGVTDLKGLKPVRTVAAPDVTHLKFARRWAPGSPRPAE